MMNLYCFSVSLLCVYGVTGDDHTSLEAILERLEDLEKTVSGQRGIIANLQDQNTKLHAQLNLQNARHQSEVDQLKLDNTRLQSEVDQLKNNNDNTKHTTDTKLTKRFVMEESEGIVAFTAAISPQLVSDVKDQEIIKFDTMVTSVGGGYNNQTGVFVAPVPGIYMFSCSLLDHKGTELAHNGAMLHAELIHNQRLLARIFAHASTAYRDQGAQTVVAEVHQGDQVFVRSIDNPDLGLGGEFYSTFSGYLLRML